MLIPPNEAQAMMTNWLTHYGSLALFALLALGIFGLPIPDETLLVFTGVLLAKGTISIYTTIPAAFLGGAFGITMSYLLGFTVGKGVLLRYGKYVGITEAKVKKTHDWFERFGKWLLLIGYYIPGVRHLTGFISGAAYLKYWEFALFAYSGAIIWSITFLSLGYFGFTEWHHIVLP